jgi:hypothetical protein
MLKSPRIFPHATSGLLRSFREVSFLRLLLAESAPTIQNARLLHKFEPGKIGFGIVRLAAPDSSQRIRSVE